MDAAWAAFSGVLTSETIEAAEWGSAVKKKPGPRSVNVFDIGAFQGASTAAPPTPKQHAVFQLTEAKVNAQPTPVDYEPPAASNILIPWATAAGGKKRKRARDTDDGDDDDMGNGDEEQEFSGSSAACANQGALRGPYALLQPKGSYPSYC